MGKTLRICLAMGGGVSLGAFSGSSLTEALKLLILYGKDAEGNHYDKVIVDGMSGASAGAIALTIMLKCLIDYKSMMSLYDATVSEASLLDELINEYFGGDRSKALAHKEIEALKALQLAQKIQYKLWVKEVNSNRLYGEKIKKDYKANINDSFALLDRGLLESLTKKYLMKTEGVDVSNRQLLDEKRVLFACSLTNLLPIEIRSAFDDVTKLEENVLKSVGSQNHSELRVIDFVFDEAAMQQKPSDSRWLKFCENPLHGSDTQFQLTSKEAWATISASALACGAFPIAFEPVILKRFHSEFGLDERYSQWPRSFMDIIDAIEESVENHGTDFKMNSYFNEGDGSDEVLDYKSYNFPYIDGGTFNNEPIREAFKIGTFQDFGKEAENSDRLILFVDPIVRQDQNHSFKISSFSPVKGKGESVGFNNELSKLLGGAASIIGVLANQGSVKEEHKIIDVKENFALRKTIFAYLEGNDNLGTTLNVDILSTTFNKIFKNLQSGIISSGTRNPIMYFINEIRKNCMEKNIPDSKCLNISAADLNEVRKQIDSGDIGTDDIEKVYTLLKLTDTDDRNTFAQTVFKVIIDFSLNTDGKNENAHRAAILPINRELDTISLPGEEIEAFGGFASEKSRQYAFQYARLSTLISLNEHAEGFRKVTDTQGQLKGIPFIHDPSLAGLKDHITAKIEGIDFYNESNPYSADLKANLFTPSVQRIKEVLLTNKFIRFILLKVPFMATSLFGPLFSLVSLGMSLFKKSPWKGTNVLTRAIKSGSDQVNYLPLEPITFCVLSDSKLKPKLFVRFEKPENKVKKIKVLQDDFKDFTGKQRYRYLFQFHLLEYLDMGKKIKAQSMTSTFSTIKMNAELVDKIRLTIQNKVQLPKNVDGNLNPEQTRQRLQDNYTDIIQEIRLDRVNLPHLNTALNEDTSSLHHSVKNINYHVNPMVEFDVQKMTEGWYFKEYTESLDRKLLR